VIPEYMTIEDVTYLEKPVSDTPSSGYQPLLQETACAYGPPLRTPHSPASSTDGSSSSESGSLPSVDEEEIHLPEVVLIPFSFFSPRFANWMFVKRSSLCLDSLRITAMSSCLPSRIPCLPSMTCRTLIRDWRKYFSLNAVSWFKEKLLLDTLFAKSARLT
jgi:hypothetical protein